MVRLRGPNRRRGGPGSRGGSPGPVLAALFCLVLCPVSSPAWESGRVAEVVDGDTLRVLAADGSALTVRLIGIDAPEKAHPVRSREFHSEESTRHLSILCEGRDVRLEPGAEGEDGYGRLLRYVFLPRGREELLVNLEMVRRGQARAMRRFAHPRQAGFVAAEELARSEGLGIWSGRGLGELAWLRDGHARPVEIWPAAGGKVIVAYRGLAKPNVGRGEIPRSVDDILRLFAEFAEDEVAGEARKAGYFPIDGAFADNAGRSGAFFAPVDARDRLPVDSEDAAAGERPAGPRSPAVVIPWEAAGKHVGRRVTVEGRIVRTWKGKKVLFLNFHPNWRKYLTLVIPGADLARFPADAERRYRDRVVRVTGEVALYDGRPEIVVRSPDAIAVVR